jgi:hypothetical protein
MDQKKDRAGPVFLILVVPCAVLFKAVHGALAFDLGLQFIFPK